MPIGPARSLSRILALVAATTPFLSLTLYAFDHVEERRQGYQRLAAKERGDHARDLLVADRYNQCAIALRLWADQGASEPYPAVAALPEIRPIRPEIGDTVDQALRAADHLESLSRNLQLNIDQSRIREREYLQTTSLPRLLFAPDPYLNRRAVNSGLASWLSSIFTCVPTNAEK